jgi:hypothetical protein
MRYPQPALEALLQASGITDCHFIEQLDSELLTKLFTAERLVLILPQCAYLFARREDQIHCTYMAVDGTADWAKPVNEAYKQAHLNLQCLTNDANFPVVFAELLLLLANDEKIPVPLDVQASLMKHRQVWANVLAQRWPAYQGLLHRLAKYHQLQALQQALSRVIPNVALWQHYAYQKRLIYRQSQHDTGWQCLSTAQLISLLNVTETENIQQCLSQLHEQQKQRVQTWERSRQPTWQAYIRQMGQLGYHSTLVGLGGELGANMGQWFSPTLATGLRRGGIGLGLAYTWSLGPYALLKTLSLAIASQQHLHLSPVDDDEAKVQGWVISATHLSYLLLMTSAVVEACIAQDSHLLGMVSLGLALSAGLSLLLQRWLPEPNAEQYVWLSSLHLMVWQVSQLLYSGLQDRFRAIERCQYNAEQMAQTLTEEGHLVRESHCNLWSPGFWLTGRPRFNVALSTPSHRHMRYICDADEMSCNLQTDSLSLPAP